jgi:hypothetical protein
VPTGFPQVVVVSGSDYEMGLQYAEQTADRIAHNVAIMKSMLYDAYGQDTVTNDMKIWDYYIREYVPSMSDWFTGMAAGCKEKSYNLDYYDMLLVAYYPAEAWARPQVPYPPEANVQAVTSTNASQGEADDAPHSCTGFAATGAATPDGKSILGFNSMVGVEAADNIILIAFPAEGATFVTQSPAGKIAGNFGMNSYGLAWGMTAITSPTTKWGLTEGYFQYMCQTPKTPAEAQAFLETTPRGGVTGGFIMADADNVMVLETNAIHYNLRKPGDLGEKGDWVVQTNHLAHPSLRADNPEWVLALRSTVERYDTVIKYLEETPPGTIDVNLTKTIIGTVDWYDASTDTWNYNQPGSPKINNSHGTTSVNIFQPATLTAYLMTGMPSGIGIPTEATGEYVKLQLKSDPKGVASQAKSDTLDIYWDAVDTFEHELNTKAAYLTLPVISNIEDKLDKAFYAYTVALDRHGYAYLESDPNRQRELWASVLTYFAQAQLYAQMAKTALLREKR